MPPPEVKVSVPCAEMYVMWSPLDGPRPAVQVKSMAECQSKCAAIDGCAHFSYYKPFKQCHFSPAYATRTEGVAAQWYMSGPPTCSGSSKSSHPQAKFSAVDPVDSTFFLAGKDGILSGLVLFIGFISGSGFVIFAAVRRVCRKKSIGIGHGYLPSTYETDAEQQGQLLPC